MAKDEKKKGKGLLGRIIDEVTGNKESKREENPNADNSASNDAPADKNEESELVSQSGDSGQTESKEVNFIEKSEPKQKNLSAKKSFGQIIADRKEASKARAAKNREQAK